MRKRPTFDWNADLAALRAARATEQPAAPISPEEAAARRQAQRDARVNTAFRSFSTRRSV